MTLRLRPARSTDAGATGHILYRFQQDTDWMPNLYSEAEAISFCGRMIDFGWVSVAVREARVQGFIARDGDEICALYLSPDARGRGIGRRLIEDAKRRSERLELKTWQANDGAQRFYRRMGFAETGRSDGADNDENLPDITFVWRQEAVT